MTSSLGKFDGIGMMSPSRSLFIFAMPSTGGMLVYMLLASKRVCYIFAGRFPRLLMV